MTVSTFLLNPKNLMTVLWTEADMVQFRIIVYESPIFQYTVAQAVPLTSSAYLPIYADIPKSQFDTEFLLFALLQLANFLTSSTRHSLI
jgi:hypothetical protein